eukprot:10815431-Lingulodinium_polyedra.AAC.1
MNTSCCASFWATTAQAPRAGNPSIGCNSYRPTMMWLRLPFRKHPTFPISAAHMCHRYPWPTYSRG